MSRRSRVTPIFTFLAQVLLLALLSSVLVPTATAADVEWVRQFGSGDALGVDAGGNVYAGGFASSGSSPFIRKYDASGKDLWTSPSCGTGFSLAREVVVSGSSVFVAGSGGGSDALICRYDTSGNLLWSRQFGTESGAVAESAAATASGVFVVGSTFGAFPGQSKTGSRDAFIRVYDLNGTELWTRQFGAASADTLATAVMVDASGVYLAGQTAGVLSGESGLGGTDAYIRKYDMTGNVLWTHQFGTPASEGEVSGSAGDSTGVYVIGTTYGGAFAGQTSAGGVSDAFIRKYATDGSVAWTKQFGTSLQDWATAVTADSTGVYVAGQTQGVLPGQAEIGATDGFVRKYDSSGNERWTRQFGTASDDFASDVSVAGEAVYVAGFTAGTFPGQTTTSGPFVAKLTAALPPNQPPTANAGGLYSVQEGGTVALSGTGTDPEGGAVSFSWDLNNDGSFEATGPNVTFSAVGLDGPASKTVTLRACDSAGLCSSTPAIVNVSNVAPVVGAIVAPATSVVVGTQASARATFTDAGAPDTHVASWNWGDGSTSSGTVTEPNGTTPGSTSSSHSYASAGIYVVTMTVTDKDGASSKSTFDSLVVVDPASGFATGGGWIDSPPGAYVPNTSLSGKANFGFNVKYEKGPTPTGQLEFQFEPARMKLQSTSYEWLVVTGTKAQFKGSGTINGTGDYGFLLTVVDGGTNGDEKVNARAGAGAFRFKVWDKRRNAVVYDNQMGAENSNASAAIGGGSVVVHGR